jgi:hypothetical protein
MSFHCFTECSKTFDIFELAIRVNQLKGTEMTFYESVKYVAGITGKWFTTTNFKKDEIVVDDKFWLDKFTKKDKILENILLPEFSEMVLSSFIPLPHEDWLNEGISYEVMEKYKISYHIRTDRIVIPHYDIDNRLIGIRGRAMLEDDMSNKYMPLVINSVDYRHNLSLNWYGINHTKNAIKRSKKAIIFEAEKSILKLDTYYGDNNTSVACCGSSISIPQRNMLIQLGVEDIYIAHDKEFTDSESQEAEKYSKKLEHLAQLFTPFMNVHVIYDDIDNLLELKDSPIDKGIEIFLQLMKTAYEVKTIEDIDKKIIKKKY